MLNFFFLFIFNDVMAEMQANGIDSSVDYSITSGSGIAMAMIFGTIFCFSIIAISYQFYKDHCRRTNTPIQATSVTISTTIPNNFALQNLTFSRGESLESFGYHGVITNITIPGHSLSGLNGSNSLSHQQMAPIPHIIENNNTEKELPPQPPPTPTFNLTPPTPPTFPTPEV